jgi:hypothetical protein
MPLFYIRDSRIANIFFVAEVGYTVTDHENLLKTSRALAIAPLSSTRRLAWPEDTELELVPPDTSFEEVPLTEATENAMVTNPEVVEAEQNVMKARAATTLAKLEP